MSGKFSVASSKSTKFVLAQFQLWRRLAYLRGCRHVPLESYHLKHVYFYQYYSSWENFVKFLLRYHSFLLVSCTTMWTLIYSATKKRKVLCLLLTQRLEILGYFCKFKKKHSQQNFCWAYSAPSSIAPLFLSQSCYFTQPRFSSGFRIQCNKLMLLAK